MFLKPKKIEILDVDLIEYNRIDIGNINWDDDQVEQVTKMIFETIIELSNRLMEASTHIGRQAVPVICTVRNQNGS
ncbi:hypothetical protein GCM10026983_42300 [Gracilibacillus alcaliphilus]